MVEKIDVSQFLVSNKIQNITQHHFEANNKGLIFDYALFVAPGPAGRSMWINDKF